MEVGDGGEGDFGAVGEGEEVVGFLYFFDCAGDGDVGAAGFVGIGLEVGDLEGGGGGGCGDVGGCGVGGEGEDVVEFEGEGLLLVGGEFGEGGGEAGGFGDGVVVAGEGGEGGKLRGTALQRHLRVSPALRMGEVDYVFVGKNVAHAVYLLFVGLLFTRPDGPCCVLLFVGQCCVARLVG